MSFLVILGACALATIGVLVALIWREDHHG